MLPPLFLHNYDPQYLNGEINFLQRSFSKVGYAPHFLDVFYLNSPRETFQLHVLSLPYTDEIYSPYSHNWWLIFNLVNTFCGNLMHTSPLSTSMVNTQAIPCFSCYRQCFGETGAGFTKHVSEKNYSLKGI